MTLFSFVTLRLFRWGANPLPVLVLCYSLYRLVQGVDRHDVEWMRRAIRFFNCVFPVIHD